MRPKRVVHLGLWTVLVLLTLHILSLTLFSGRGGDAYTDDEDENIELTLSARRVKSLNREEEKHVLVQLRRSRWHLTEFRPDEMTGPLPLTLTPPVLEDEMSQPAAVDFLVDVMRANRSEIRDLLHRINSQQVIVNARIYNRTDCVIAVQVHDRAEYLKLLIDSLRRAKDIHRCLLVFSHDVYSASLNRLVRSIGFARVLQIFFPYSQQIYRREFPGADSRDCARDTNRAEAERIGCLNAQWPDSYGHYREPAFCQTKHHWFWKMNFLFEHVRAMRGYAGPVLFLEEDHYVVEDFLHMLKVMHDFREKSYPKVSILCLGTYERKTDYNPSNRVQVGKWVSSFHNMGMTITRSVWQKIRACTKAFCDFDDYNWDWSLYFVSLKCLSSPLQVMLLKHSPRVYHIGECGVHHKKRVCSPLARVAHIDKEMEANLPQLYPRDLSHIGDISIQTRTPKPNGGWGDFRDRTLCRSYILGGRNESTFPVPEDRESDVDEKWLLAETDVTARRTNGSSRSGRVVGRTHRHSGSIT